MPRFFLSASPNDGFFEITGDDARHISFSLRMRCGEHLVVCDGEGTDYECVIQTEKEQLHCTGRIKERYYGMAGKTFKFEIENGFYKINLKQVDKQMAQ